MVVLIALCAGGLVFVEYASQSPSIIEFRNAPPYNRTRFVALFLSVFAVSALFRGIHDPAPLTHLLFLVSQNIAAVLDFPYSPVRLIVLALADQSDLHQIFMIRTAAGLAALINASCLIVFLLLLRMGDWPVRKGAFNVWINLPTFDPTTGGDIVERLQRDGRINIGLGVLLPFIIPVSLHVSSELAGGMSFHAPQTLAWLVAAWSFLPLCLIMRGIAMARLANLIVGTRRRASIEGPEARIFAL